MTFQQLKYVLEVARVSSITEASKRVFVSQPSLTASIKDLEEELGIRIFERSSKGVNLTHEGEEFLSYARQVQEQFLLMEERYKGNHEERALFSVSCQHYSFAVKAFIEMAKNYNSNQFDLALRETRTIDVLKDVSSLKSEIGLIYISEANQKGIKRLLREHELNFTPLIECPASVYLSRSHPLAGEKELTFEQLEPYPCLSFEQGENNSFYFAEEVLSTFDYRQQIRVNDRATMLNMMIGFHGYTLCSGIICTDLNGSSYTAIPFASEEKMTIGYIKKKNLTLDKLGQTYVEELKKYEDYIPTGQFEKPYLLQA